MIPKHRASRTRALCLLLKHQKDKAESSSGPAGGGPGNPTSSIPAPSMSNHSVSDWHDPVILNARAPNARLAGRNGNGVHVLFAVPHGNSGCQLSVLVSGRSVCHSPWRIKLALKVGDENGI